MALIRYDAFPAGLGAMPVRADGQARATRLWCVLLFACLVQFTSAWVYPYVRFDLSGAAEAFETGKRFGVPFQYLMWLIISFVIFTTSRRYGLSAYRLLLPFFPYGAACVLAGLLGFHPVGAVRATIFWIFALMSATAIALALPREVLRDALLTCLSVLMVGSIALALLYPDAGTRPYGTNPVWCGVFNNKNQLGWIAALSLVIAAAYWRDASSRLVGVLIASSVICLVFSQSKGALGSSIATCAYVATLVWLRRRTTPGLAYVALALLIGFAMVGLTFVAADVAGAMGRDLTFTGRTTIWSTYLQAMLRAPILGQGPGAFTGMSPLTEPLAYSLGHFGFIFTPHNMFLGVFGDSGIIGLVAFVALLGYLCLVLPFRSPTSEGKALAGVTFATAMLGMSETHDTFEAGPTWFLLPLLLVACRLAQRQPVPAPMRT